LPTRSTSSLTCISMDGSRVGFSLPEYYKILVSKCFDGRFDSALSRRAVRTHPSSHLLSSGIVAVIVTFCEHIILARLESGGMIIPWCSLVW
jgi:hypothetical protein